MKAIYLPNYLLVATLLTSYYLGYTPLFLAVIFLAASLLAYMAYAIDKSAAKKGEWRVSEIKLHLLSLLCGWPGALIAQQKLRHKTQKISFRIIFWSSLLINFSAILWLHLPTGSSILQSTLYKLETFTANELGSGSLASAILFLTKLYSGV